jgi:aminoglycoside 3-N-acetyltransferase
MTLLQQIKNGLRNKFKSFRRLGQAVKAGPPVTKDQIIKDLKRLGIERGSVVLVHSSLSSPGLTKGGARTLIDALLKAVSQEGTIVIPTYHMLEGSMLKTCESEDYIFDPVNGGTFVGAVPSAFLKYKDRERSIHPTHSVSAIGKYAKDITGEHHLAASTFGSNSPWDKLYKMNAIVLGLGVTMAPPAIYHYLEDMNSDFPIKVKLDKIYQVKCKDFQGNIINVPVQPHDPEVAKNRIDVQNFLDDYFRDEFTESGLLKRGLVGKASSWMIPFQPFYNHLVELMKEGITIYSTEADLAKRPLRESYKWVGRYFYINGK